MKRLPLLFVLLMAFVASVSAQELGNRQITLGNISNPQLRGEAIYILRFPNTVSGTPKRWDWWWSMSPWDSGYASGNGGVYLVTIQGDDRNGKPDGVVHAAGVFWVNKNNPNPGDWSLYQFRPLEFEERFHPGQTPPGIDPKYRLRPIEAGKYYNVCFDNICDHPNYGGVSPWDNWCSTDGPFSRDRNFDPGFEMNRLNPRTGKFTRNYNSVRNIPPWALTFADDKQVGQPLMYGEYWAGRPQISGPHQIAQVLIAPEDKSLSKVTVWATRVGGHSPLTVTVTIDRVFQKQLQIPASSFPVLSMEQPLEPGTELRFSGRDDYPNYARVEVPLEIDVKAGDMIGLIFSTNTDSRYYLPGSVIAGGYTGIRSRDLIATRGALQSSDNGLTWKPYEVGPRANPQPRDSVVLSAMLE